MADPDSTNQPTAVFTAAYEVTAWYDADNAVTARDAVESGVRLDLPGQPDRKALPVRPVKWGLPAG